MGNITIEKYDQTNYDHKYVIVTLGNDDDFNKYVGDIYHLIENVEEKRKKGQNDQLYIAYDGELPIGMVELRILEGLPYINIGIITEYRGYHYGRMLFSYFVDYLYALNREYDILYASINPQNKTSIDNVLSLGFQRVSHTKYAKKRE